MTATTNLLIERINEQEDAIKAAAESGHDTKEMREELIKLKAQLLASNKALTESKKLITG